MAQLSPTALQSTLKPKVPFPRIELAQSRSGAPSYGFESEVIKSDFDTRISVLETEVKRLKKGAVGYVKISLLPNETLRVPLDAIIEPDGDDFIAKTIDLPLYGHGGDPVEAIEMLKREIASLYRDLIDDEELTEDWLRIKSFLVDRISR
jgi:hypothetical protein